MAHILAQLARDPGAVLRAIGGASKRDLAKVNKRVKDLESVINEISLGPEDLPDEAGLLEAVEHIKEINAENAILDAAEADAALEDLTAAPDDEAPEGALI